MVFKISDKFISTGTFHVDTGRKVGKANQVGIHLRNQDLPSILIDYFYLYFYFYTNVDKFSICKLRHLLFLTCYYIYPRTSLEEMELNPPLSFIYKGREGGRTPQDFLGEKVRSELSKLHQPSFDSFLPPKR